MINVKVIIVRWFTEFYHLPTSLKQLIKIDKVFLTSLLKNIVMGWQLEMEKQISKISKMRA